MPRVKKLEIDKYWAKGFLLLTLIFPQIMSRDQFKLIILRLLHFCDNLTPTQDSLVKIWLIIEHTRKKFREALNQFENLVIDTSLLLFKGHLQFKQYIPKKRGHFGIKMFVLCDVEGNYIIDYIIYAGAGTEIMSGNANWGKSGDVVVSLLPYLNQGHTIYLNNWYSSPDLFLWLNEKLTNAVGTVRKNRKKKVPPMSEKLKKGEIQFRSSGTLLALKWMDNKEVWMLSTVHGPQMVETDKKEHTTGQKKIKPACVVDYNKSMGAVNKTT